MRNTIERERARMFKRYVASKRHTMQVDFDNYLYGIGQEMSAGAKRALAAGSRLPVTPRAGTASLA
jgi:dimethylaniline monooxygenase (N-oxide forming)